MTGALNSSKWKRLRCYFGQETKKKKKISLRKFPTLSELFALRFNKYRTTNLNCSLLSRYCVLNVFYSLMSTNNKLNK